DSDYLLDEVRTSVTQPELPTEVDYVRVMSPHKSKGLTAELVIVAGCLEGLIPFVDRDLEGAALEASIQEQRRLFYVAITRTKQTLVLSSSATLPRALAYKMGARVLGNYGATAPTVASRFLIECGPNTPATLTGPAFRNATRL